MQIKKLTLNTPAYPQRLEALDTPPNPLYYAGAPLNELLERRAVAIVGSRRISIYGEQVTRRFAKELAGQGIVIVSGLALGVDGLAHRAALEADGLCIAVLPCPIDKIVPVSNQRLAQAILNKGGALLSEYPPGDVPFKQNFISRNRIVAGLAEAVLITEAEITSGTRHTVRYADKLGRNIYVVPGNITNLGSAGANNFIKTNRGQLVTEPQDVLLGLEIVPHKTRLKQVRGGNANEQKLLDLMLTGVTDGDELLAKSGLELSRFNQALTMLELSGKVRPLGMNHWAIF